MFQVKSLFQHVWVRPLIVLWLCFASTMLAMPMGWADSKTDTLKINTIQYAASRQAVLIQAQPGVQFQPSGYSGFRLSEPDRLIVDIPNASLLTTARTVPINQNGLDHIELSQNVGTFYQIVRLTIVANSPKALDSIRFVPQENRLLVSFQPGTPALTMETPAANPAPVVRKSKAVQKTVSFLDTPADALTAINNLHVDNGTITIQSASGRPVLVKQQFTLSNPSRLVIDFAQTTLADKSLLAPIWVNSASIQTVRLGQFDESTVRLVIETPDPRLISMAYGSSDKSVVSFSTTDNAANSTMASNVVAPYETISRPRMEAGAITDLSLSRQGASRILHIATSSPMSQKVIRNGLNVEAALDNINVKPVQYGFDHNLFPEFRNIQVINSHEPGTTMVITMDTSRYDVDSHTSLDGKSLDIVFTPKGTASAYKPNLGLPTVIQGDQTANTNDPDNGIDWSSFPIGKLKSGLTVVVDAGHGGKDLGANRAGVNEKDLNLSVALKVKQALEARKIKVYMTRSVDKFLELSQITAITNRIQPDAFVSVHTNASVNTTMNGIETYYLTPQSRRLAFSVHKRMVANVGAPDRGVRTARFYVIHHTNVPAILCEMGYISNNGERDALQTEARQRATADGIAQGVLEFLGSQFKAEADVP